MTKISLPGRSALLLTLLATATVFVWLWDISWGATIPGAEPWDVSHILAILGCAVWTILLVFRSPSRRWALILGALSFLLILGVPGVSILEPGGGGTGIGYLTKGNLLLSVLVGNLAIWTLWASPAAPPGPVGFSALQALLPGALVLVWAGTLFIDLTGWPNLWRGPEFLLVVGCLFGLPLALLARSNPFRWSATGTAIVYSFLVVLAGGILYILPLSWFTSASGQEHFRILPVPLLLFLPGWAVDWLEMRSWPARSPLGDFLRAGLMGAAFLGVTWIAHWFAADLFVAHSGVGREVADLWWPVRGLGGDWQSRYWNLLPGKRRWALGMASALAGATISAWMGLWLGERIRFKRQPLD